jgi:hypothetical protein
VSSSVYHRMLRDFLKLSDHLTNLLENDVICFSETWTNKSSVIDLNGYHKPIHSYRRFQHIRTKRSSSGLIIYI